MYLHCQHATHCTRRRRNRGAILHISSYVIYLLSHLEELESLSVVYASCSELCYRGRHIMMGYLANPSLGAEHVAEIEQKTADAIDADGWLHSADKGCVVRGHNLSSTCALVDGLYACGCRCLCVGTICGIDGA